MRLQKGQSTVPFQRCGSNKEVKDKTSMSFSIIYENAYGSETSLDLVAGTDEQASKWYSELESLIKFLNEEKCAVDPVMRFAKRAWDHADSDKSGTLELKEIVQVIHRLNISLDAAYIKKQFGKVDVDGSGDLDFQEFLVLMEKLSKRVDILGCWNALNNGSMFEASATAKSMTEVIEKSVVSR